MNSELSSILVATIASTLTTTTIVLAVEVRRLRRRLHDAEQARIEAEEAAAWAQHATDQAQQACIEAQDAAIEAQQKFNALMERYKWNVQQCLQAGLAAIVMERNTN